tara:strand:+ start:302 stop:1192 length:891 start_codon:yes stop_codon:yes gene_type:complete
MYLTPFRIDGFNVFGAVYDQDRRIIVDSLRLSQNAAYVHQDPAYLLPQDASQSIPLCGNHSYLGHAFQGYGHFLLETLPMLEYFLINEFSSGVFLPWGSPRHVTSLLYTFLDLLMINRDRVVVWDKSDIAMNIVECRPRSVEINNCIINKQPYLRVLSQILSTIATDKITEKRRNVFLSRNANRVSSYVNATIEEVFREVGFDIIKPETMSILDQIKLMQSARIIAGFAGSQLHNSIFCREGTFVISLGDERSPGAIIPNQLMCDSISGAISMLAPYSKSKESMIDSVVSLLKQIG